MAGNRAMKKARNPLWKIEDGRVVKYDTLSEAAGLNDMDTSEVSVAKSLAVSAGANSFFAGGVMFYLAEPVVVGKRAVVVTSVRAEGGPLLAGLCTHRLGVYRGEAV